MNEHKMNIKWSVLRAHYKIDSMCIPFTTVLHYKMQNASLWLQHVIWPMHLHCNIVFLLQHWGLLIDFQDQYQRDRVTEILFRILNWALCGVLSCVYFCLSVPRIEATRWPIIEVKSWPQFCQLKRGSWSQREADHWPATYWYLHPLCYVFKGFLAIIIKYQTLFFIPCL